MKQFILCGGFCVITAFSIQPRERRQGFGGVLDFLRRDRVEVTVRQARGVYVKQVVYHAYGRRVRLERADKAVGGARGQLLCDAALSFPQGSGFRRFSSQSFSQRICGNFFLAALREADNPSLRVGIYDPDAVATDIMFHVLERCKDVKIVTRQGRRYALAANRALEELGATAVITERPEELDDRDFVLAPCEIGEPLPLHADCVTLTVGQPKAPVGGSVFGSYHFRMPNGFAELKPEGMSEEYFCSALYTLGSQYELGSIVPLSCSDNSISQTAQSIGRMLA